MFKWIYFNRFKYVRGHVEAFNRVSVQSLHGKEMT